MKRCSFPPCPPANEGVNVWLYTTSLSLIRQGATDEEIERILRAGIAGCGRCERGNEVQRAIENARSNILQSGQRKPKGAGPWPKPCIKSIREARSSNVSLQDWKDQSPVPIDPNRNFAETVLDAFFEPSELVCAGYTQQGAETKPREEWRGQEENLQFMVPSPMSKVLGLNQKGKLSRRCLDNTGPRRFLIIERDTGLLDEQASILAVLWKLAPLVAIVYSGGKSLHGWFDCRGVRETVLRRFMEYAVKLGADPRLWSRCQLVRIPDGLRDDGRRQRLIYFDPSKLRREQ